MAKSGAKTTIEPGSHSARMLSCLKEIFHAQRIRYADVAELMNVSEKSVKRYMSGRGVTLPTLERLCAAAGMNLAELSGLAGNPDDRERPWTTDEQEAVLASEPRLAMVLALLTGGWTAARMVREGLTSLSDLTSILIRLDRLGVLTLHPNNRTVLRVRLRSIDNASDPLRRVITIAGHRILADLDLADPTAHWRLGYARLGPASVERAIQRMKAFLEEVAELGRQDMDLGGDQVKWHAICAVITEHEVLGLQRLRPAERGKAAETS